MLGLRDKFVAILDEFLCGDDFVVEANDLESVFDLVGWFTKRVDFCLHIDDCVFASGFDGADLLRCKGKAPGFVDFSDDHASEAVCLRAIAVEVQCKLGQWQ